MEYSTDTPTTLASLMQKYITWQVFIVMDANLHPRPCLNYLGGCNFASVRVKGLNSLFAIIRVASIN